MTVKPFATEIEVSKLNPADRLSVVRDQENVVTVKAIGEDGSETVLATSKEESST